MHMKFFGILIVLTMLIGNTVFADGKIVMPLDYEGSLEESAQEAIIIFTGNAKKGEFNEDMILKISVIGEAKNFAWIVPFPNEPEIEKEDNKLFEELFDYVESKRIRHRGNFEGEKDDAKSAAEEGKEAVKVLKREIVGSFDISVVQEIEAGTLNDWLEENGYQRLENSEDVIGFYREKGYVFACIKVSDVELSKDKPVDTHPLRFSFATGGSDGIFFPMKMTGLQSEPFTINLYVFYSAWLNDKLNQFGYVHRGFMLKFRDYDSRECTTNAGKIYSTPEIDPYLKYSSHLIPTVKKLFQKLYPGRRFYLTNIISDGKFKPENVRVWNDDLWLFPYYTDKSMIPFDARAENVASQAFPDLPVNQNMATENVDYGFSIGLIVLIIVIFDGIVLVFIIGYIRKKRRNADVSELN